MTTTLIILAAMGWLLAIIFAGAYLDVARAHAHFVRDQQAWMHEVEGYLEAMQAQSRPSDATNGAKSQHGGE